MKLLLFAGPPSSGKSSVSRKAAEALPGKVAYISMDKVKHFELGCPPDRTGLMYKNTMLLLKSFAEEGFDVVLDEAFIQKGSLKSFADEGKGLGYDVRAFVLDAPLETLLERLRERNRGKALDKRLGEGELKRAYGIYMENRSIILKESGAQLIGTGGMSEAEVVDVVLGKL